MTFPARSSAFLFVHGSIRSRNGWVEAAAVQNGRFVAVGSRAEVDATLRPHSVAPLPEIDLGGGFLIPGFIDAHMHPLWGAVFQESGILLQDDAGQFLSTREGVTTAVEQWIRRNPGGPDDWAVGYGWSPGLAREAGFNRHLLDRVSGARPVYLLSLDAHFALVNTAGLKRLGAIAFPPDSGSIPAGADGAPCGLLLETPQFIATMRVIGQIPFAQKAAAFEQFQARALACGITTINDIVTDMDALAFYARLVEEGRLRLRIDCSPYGPLEAGGEMQEYLDQRRIPRERLGLGAVKYLLDGTPGNHNAAWFQVYADDPSTSGFLTIGPDALTEVVRQAEREGFDLALHAAGDLSVHAALDAIEFGTEAGATRQRHRVEHFDNVTANDRRRLPRLAGRGLVASVQPTHFAEVYMATIRKVLGPERIEREYPLAVFLRSGVPLAINTDWPAALTFSPLENMQLAEQHGAESLTAEEALRAATEGNAFAMRREEEIGKIEPGYRADAVLLNGDPTQRDPQHLQVKASWIGGEVAFGQNE